MIQAYQDTFYTTSAETLEFYLTDGTNKIFAGKAYKYPDGSDLTIKINDIVSSYLKSELPATVWTANTGNVTIVDAIKTFYLYDVNDTQLATYQFINDWSYGPYSASLSHPINGKYATGMYCFSSSVSSNNVVVNFRKNGGNGYTKLVCGDYALYYCNRNCGWDGLVLSKCVENKNLEHFDYSKTINNNTIDRESNRFQTNIKSNWEANSGWLSDAESKILYDNLLTSNNIYLHNLNTNKIYPVHIVDTEATRKEFLNEMSLISYTFKLESDNIEIRK